MSIEAMKQALKVLENPWGAGPEGVANAITALRTAIEEAEKQEPIGEVVVESMGVRGSDAMQVRIHFHEVPPVGTKIYSAPQKPEWIGLTHDEVNSWELPDRPTVFEFAQFIEAKLKEKNA